MLMEHYLGMAPVDRFWNRKEELAQIRSYMPRGGFGYVTGRRRIGKTALLKEACKAFHGFYHQAVEGTPEQQLIHLAEELGQVLPIFREVVPRSWTEFFRLLSKEKLPKLVVFDEFPYWAEGDRMVPSLFQKWIDHELPQFKTLVLVSGSSQSMLYSQFLEQGSPLYGRALVHWRLEPMSYLWFCRALKYNPGDPLSFTRFSLVGGVPHYWKLMPRGSMIRQAEELYFSPSAILAEEPTNWIRDERITGNLPRAILDFIGRGVRKPSELASRLGTVQGNLSRPMALLLDLGLIQRETPFSESARSTKKALYRIQDAALSFYYGVFLPNRAAWNQLGHSEKTHLLERHTSDQWEFFCRSRYPASGRYWEAKAEIDLIAPLKGRRQFLVAECKWSWVGGRQEKRLVEELKQKFQETEIGGRLGKSSKIIFQIFSKKDLSRFAGAL